jgi:uncharacterized protein with PhoU and TrkA domain
MSDEEDKTEYKPRSVKDILTDMKDASELIVDLAYSALIFNSKDIADEVRELEEKMDSLKYDIRLMAMVAARTMEEAEQLTGILQVAQAAENIANAAGDIVNLLDVDLETRPFLPFLLDDADEKIKMIKIGDSSPIHGLSFEELNPDEMGVRVIAVRRIKKWIYDPLDDFKVRKGDMLVARGVADGIDRFRQVTLQGLPSIQPTTTRPDGGGA